MFLGIEIGGTKLQFGVGPGDGTLAAFRRLAVDVSAGGEGIRRAILGTVPALLVEAKLSHSDIKGIGFGFGGPVDDATRRVITSHQVSGWDDFPLAEWAEANLHVACVLGNDADAAGLAEAVIGAGKGLSPVFYMNIGSGIGGALIIDGEIYRGVGRGAVEIGHLRVDHDMETDLSPTRQRGNTSSDALAGASGSHPHGWRSLEHAASGWAIARDARAAGFNPAARAEDVAAAAKRGDSAALNILQTARRRVAVALSHVIALLCPRRIVIGGGVSLMGEELFFEPLRREVAAIAFRPFAECYDIVPAALGEAVVVHGALSLAKQAESERVGG